MRKKFRLPSPALILSMLALFVALGGGVYAASKIDGKSIKPKSLPGNRIKPDTVTGKQVKESSLAQVPSAAQATNAQTAKSAANADKVDGHDAACPSGTRLFLGSCWDNSPRAAATVSAAEATCNGQGGALPPTHQLVAFSKVVTLGNTGEWSSEINTVEALDKYSEITVSNTGSINFDAPTDTKEFHCVFPLLR
jgi:hypothetical protein